MPRSVSVSRRPSATPSNTPCFVSPRMAFTQFSYDSPIQVISCVGGDVLNPMTKWKSRLPLGSLLCSRKGLLLLALLTIGLVSLFLLSGKDALLAEEYCDANDSTTPCHSHKVISPLQIFLKRESSAGEQSDADTDTQHDEAAAAQEGDQVEVTEQRNKRPRMLTVQGLYEEGIEEMDYDASEELDGRNEEQGEKHDGEEIQQFPSDSLLRAVRAVGGKERANQDADVSAGEQHPMRSHTEEVPHDYVPEARPEEYMGDEPFQREQEALDQLYIQRRNLERQNYHREQQIVQQEIDELEMSKRRQQEELWEEQRRQAHYRMREGHPQAHPRRPGGGEQWHPSSRDGPYQREDGGMEGRHPAWRDHQLHGQRLPKGVNPRRYYTHDGF